MKSFLMSMAVAFFFAQAALAQSLDQVYVGYMEIGEGDSTRRIPLSLSMVFTGEIEVTPEGEERQVIDASFIVDEEGGPYSFAKVTYDFFDASIDLRYDRPNNNSGSVPASFRLVGVIDEAARITGRVLSGQRGHIGRFVLQGDAQEAMGTRAKYRGDWQGLATKTEGGTVPLRIVVQNANTTTTNPLDYEFDFSLGKVSYVQWNNTKISMTDVYIDYLRRRVVLTRRNGAAAPELTVEFQMDFATNKIKGSINSARLGETARFEIASRQDEPDSGPDESKRIALENHPLAFAYGEAQLTPVIELDRSLEASKIQLFLTGDLCPARLDGVLVVAQDNAPPRRLRDLGYGQFDSGYLNGKFEFARLQLIVSQTLLHEASCRLRIEYTPYEELPPPLGPSPDR